MRLSEKNLREKKFHNELQSKSTGRFENIFYKAIINAWEDFYKYLKLNANNSEILDYGCGVGPIIEKVIDYNPKKIVGIDISDISISKAKKKLHNHEDKISLLVDNCEKTKFSDNKFNIVYGLGILHHLQLSQSINEIGRILKPNGTLLFIEPLGTNPIINLYRKLTPASRSKDEHPLIEKDFELIRKKFTSVTLKYYGFFTLIFFPFYRSNKSIIFRTLVKLDQLFFKIKIFRLLAWSVLIIAKKS
jgi:ubiquinone/menaquinone biosynthesis C-methylase UbiE|tara:strand:- start:940 stop:1680 length:741 start_codon:yes stop_codon:yes gene_type:complete